MRNAKTLVASALLAATGAAQAELSANIAAVSNYYFRGITQTDDKAAVWGGVDWAHDSGFYLGTWMSNVDFGGKEDMEVDFYGGFGGDIGDSGFGYDLSLLYYWYPGAGGDQQGGELDYAEATASLSWAWLTGTISYTFWAEQDGNNNTPFQEDDIYYGLSVDPGWEYEGFAPSAFIGYYDFDKDGKSDNSSFECSDPSDCEYSYTHWGISITKDAGDFGSFGLTYEQIDDQYDTSSDDNPNFWLGWSKEF
jgi:uncharacterized protein (TIGR02001 family)